MSEVALFDAKNRLSELIDRLQAGETFTITRRGRVVACLVLPGPPNGSDSALAAVERVRASRVGFKLGRLRSQDLIREGRR